MLVDRDLLNDMNERNRRIMIRHIAGVMNRNAAYDPSTVFTRNRTN